MLSQIGQQRDDHIAARLIDQLTAFTMAIQQTRLLQGFQMKR